LKGRPKLSASPFFPLFFLNNQSSFSFLIVTISFGI
jgi:hypothetical protein